MMKIEFKALLPILAISILNYLVWTFFKTPLNDENLQLTGPIKNLSTSGIEFLKYGIISFLLALNFIFPFYMKKDFVPKRPYWVGLISFSITFFLAAYLLSHNVKGIYLVRYMGDDFPFIWRIITFFFYFPFVLFFITNWTIFNLKKRNLFFLFVTGMLPDIISSDLGTSFGSMASLRAAVSGGQTVFWVTLLYGVLVWFMSITEISNKQ